MSVAPESNSHAALLYARLVPSALVVLGRGSTGALPVAITAIASKTYGLEVMGAMSTALMLAYATAEVADGFSQRYVPRLVGRETPNAVVEALAEFNGLRFLMLAAGFLLSGFAIHFIGVARDIWPYFVLPVAVWTTIVSLQYATALATDDYATMGTGPVVALGALGGIFVLLHVVSPSWGPWNLVIALNASRLLELGWLRTRHPWSGARFRLAGLAAQWRMVRYLVGQTLLSALHVRLVVPLVALLAGLSGAGAFSIALSLLAVVSLSVASIATPAFRRSVSRGAPNDLREAWLRTRVDFVLGLLVCTSLVLAIWVATPWVVSLLFGITDPAVFRIVRIILVGGLFESMALFATVWYHASFRDRDLLILSAISVASGWAALIAGHYVAQLPGMAWGFSLTRALAVVLISAPLLASFLRDRPDAQVAQSDR